MDLNKSAPMIKTTKSQLRVKRIPEGMEPIVEVYEPEEEEPEENEKKKK